MVHGQTLENQRKRFWLGYDTKDDMYEADVTVIKTSMMTLLMINIDFMLGDIYDRDYIVHAEYIRYDNNKLTSSGVLKTHENKFVVITDRPA